MTIRPFARLSLAAGLAVAAFAATPSNAANFAFPAVEMGSSPTLSLGPSSLAQQAKQATEPELTRIAASRTTKRRTAVKTRVRRNAKPRVNHARKLTGTRKPQASKLTEIYFEGAYIIH